MVFALKSLVQIVHHRLSRGPHSLLVDQTVRFSWTLKKGLLGDSVQMQQWQRKKWFPHCSTCHRVGFLKSCSLCLARITQPQSFYQPELPSPSHKDSLHQRVSFLAQVRRKYKPSLHTLPSGFPMMLSQCIQQLFPWFTIIRHLAWPALGMLIEGIQYIWKALPSRNLVWLLFILPA